MQEKTVTIVNKLGLHARASSKLVQLANNFKSEITVARGSRVVNAKSIMGLMMLAASKGTEICLKTDGEDEDAAMEALTILIADKFGEGS